MNNKTKERGTYTDIQNIFFGIGFWILEFKIKSIIIYRPESIILHDNIFSIISITGD